MVIWTTFGGKVTYNAYSTLKNLLITKYQPSISILSAKRTLYKVGLAQARKCPPLFLADIQAYRGAVRSEEGFLGLLDHV